MDKATKDAAAIAQAAVDGIDMDELEKRDLDFTTEGEAALVAAFTAELAPILALADRMAEVYPELPSAEGLENQAFSLALGAALRERSNVTRRRAAAIREYLAKRALHERLHGADAGRLPTGETRG